MRRSYSAAGTFSLSLSRLDIGKPPGDIHRWRRTNLVVTGLWLLAFVQSPVKVVIIKRENRSDEDVTIAIPENWFDNNPLLEEIRFEDWTFDIPRGTFTKLHNLTELQLSEQRIAGDHLKHRIVLSKRSPLFMQVEDEEWLRHGYVLVNANED